jgi:hypothetical protein
MRGVKGIVVRGKEDGYRENARNGTFWPGRGREFLFRIKASAIRLLRSVMTRTGAISKFRLLSLSIAVAAGIGANAAAQSRVDRLHFDKMHVWMDCTSDCDVDWKMWDLHRSSHFTVRVSFRQQPLAGVRVSLTSEDALPDGSGRHVMAARNTDEDGAATFSDIPPGRYIAHVNQGLLAQSQDVDVEAENSSTGEMRLEWPVAPIATRSVRGWISAWERVTPQNRSQRVALSNAQVQLFDLRSGQQVGSVRTDADGYYEFPDFADGLYVVRVSEGQYPSMKGYDEAVEVASRAGQQQLPGFVVDHVCDGGLSRLDPRHESQEPCVPTGAADPRPPIWQGQQNRALSGAVVIIVRQQVVVLR